MDNTSVPKYPKINGLFKRDQSPGENHNKFIIGDYSCPEFEYLKNNQWVFTEKIHGTNIRVHLEDDGTIVRGRTDRAEIPEFLWEKLCKLFPTPFPEESRRWLLGWPEDSVSEVPPITLFGEGYGRKIQKEGVLYNPDGVDFVLFDVLAGNTWLGYDEVCKVAGKLALKVVPLVKTTTLLTMLQLIRNGSLCSAWGKFRIEGVVGVTATPIRDRYGRRIQVKIKHSDFGFPMKLRED